MALSNVALGWLGGVAGMSIALLGLGLGWNLSYVAATTELVALTSPSERGRLVGFTDLLASFTAAGAGAPRRPRLQRLGRPGPLALAAAALAALPALWLALRPVPRVALADSPFRYNPAPADAWSAAFLSMKTYNAKPGEIARDWYVVDAEGKTLGRLATQIADTLRGKRKPQYTPHVDTGDFVVVVNAEKIVVTGNKLDQKRYYRHSGYPGGLKSRTLREQLDRRPTEVIRTAVKGMLPRNRLARQQLTKLKVYAGPEHPHGPQNPQPLNLEQ